MERFDLAVADIGKLATALVDAATIVVATPTVLGGPHPLAAYAAGMTPNPDVQLIDPYLTKGAPDHSDCGSIAALAREITKRHEEIHY